LGGNDEAVLVLVRKLSGGADDLVRRQLGIAHCVLDVLVPEPSL
jgi:hypothetical protein